MTCFNIVPVVCYHVRKKDTCLNGTCLPLSSHTLTYAICHWWIRQTVIIQAAMAGNVACVQYQLANGVNIDATSTELQVIYHGGVGF